MTILAQIVAHKRREVGRLPPAVSPATDLPPRRSLVAAIRGSGPVALIAEIKRRSPSHPSPRADFDPPRMAAAYAAGGAAALSILTDDKYFGGELGHLGAARGACDLPVLRKDFILDARQIGESKLAGADAVLLIAACLDDAELGALAAQAARWDLEALVEVHDAHELGRALALGAPLIGINNRDLRTFEVDLGTTERLAAHVSTVPPDRRPLLVSESGIAAPRDLGRLAACGCAAVLVGESLLNQGDLKVAARRLLSSEVAGFRAAPDGAQEGAPGP